MFWFAQILAIIICIISSISYFSKRKDTYLGVQFVVNILYGTQYLLLGAFSGAISNAVSLIKYIVFYRNAKQSKKNPTWQAIFFCLLSVGLGCLAINGWYTLVPIITSLIFTFAIWQDNPIVLRIIVIVCNALWIVFNLSVGAYVSAAYSFIELTMAFITMIKLISGRNKKDEIQNY